MESYKTYLLAGAALLGASASFIDAPAEAGYYGSGWPTPSTTNGTLPLTGNETAVYDTNLPSGQQPQSEIISTGQLANYIGASGVGSRNALIGGDFATNLWQRGTSPGGDIGATLTYTADRWFAVATTAGTINVTKQTASQAAGVGASLRFQRKAGDTNLNLIQLGQTIATANSWNFVGRTAVLSFYAKAGATFITAPASFNVAVATGTAADGTAATMAAGTWTGQINNPGSITPTSGWVRYSFAVPIAATSKQVGVLFSWTPTTATAGATEYIEIANVQLEAASLSPAWAAASNYAAGETVVSNGNLYTEVASTCVAGNVSTAPTGQTNGQVDNTCTWNFLNTGAVPVQPTRFDSRLQAAESALQYPYFFRVNEPTAGAPVAPCHAISTTQAKCDVVMPAPLRSATITETIATGTFAAETSAGAAASACTVVGAQLLATPSNGAVQVSCAASTFVGGYATLLIGASGTGTLDFSAEY